MIDEAKELFLGKKGVKRINCAQAIASVCNQKYPGNEKLVKLFKSFGQGKAPNKWCGAYYAAHYMLEKHHPEKIEEMSNNFLEKAGDLVCKKIQKLKKLSCAGCVEVAAEYCATLTE